MKEEIFVLGLLRKLSSGFLKQELLIMMIENMYGVFPMLMALFSVLYKD